MTAPTAGGTSQPPAKHPHEPESSLWEARLAALIAALLFIPLPPQLTLGPTWVVSLLVVLVLIPLLLLQEAIRRPGGWEPSPRHLRVLALILLGILALAEASTLGLLLSQLAKVGQANLLFRSAALIWMINLLVFALVYWELDGGGPGLRPPADYPPTDFLFPQQTDPKLNAGWAPQFVDYLFLAFNTSTAFSPTDTMILSREAKGYMMAQATIAALTVALVIARGVNIIR